MSDIFDRLDNNAEAWKPKSGDKIVGTVKSVEIFDGQYGEYPLLILEKDDGAEVAVHAFHTVLKSEMVRKKPQPGDRLGIKYIGLSEKGYESYRVLIEAQTPTAAIDWDSVESPDAETAREEAPPDREEAPLPDENYLPVASG